MGWQSGVLGGNVVSSYLHVDNLRNDLVTGKFWDASDGSETKYLRVSHSGSAGLISSSSGEIRMNGGAGGVLVENAGGDQYVAISHSGTEAGIYSTIGPVRVDAGGEGLAVVSFNGADTVNVLYGMGGAYITTSSGLLQIGFSGMAVMSSDGAKQLQFVHNGTDGVVIDHCISNAIVSVKKEAA